MAGLVSASTSLVLHGLQDVDARHKAGHDEGGFSWEIHRVLPDWRRGCVAAPRSPASTPETVRTNARRQASRPRRADAASRRPIPAVPDWLLPARRETAAHRDNRGRSG